MVRRMRRQQGKKRNCRMLSLALSAVLAVTACVTAPVAVNAAETGSSELKNPRVVMNYCDTVYFGHYLQEDTNGDGTVDERDDKQPIQWRILWQNEDGTDAYVIADKVLDCQPYNKKDTGVTWETCTLREWLNDDFSNTAFTTEEQKAIIEQDLVNEDNEIYGTSGGNDTKDMVYLPSLSEMKNTSYGFSDNYGFPDQVRLGKATQYAKEQGVWTNGEMSSWWWLRSPGRYTSDAFLASGVNINGYVYAYGNYVGSLYVGVRPALHINLSSSLVKEGEKVEVSLKSAEWDTVELGTYNGRPITWRVLSISGQDVFLLSDQILTDKEYHDTDESVTWENSTLRNWLNGEFYQGVFNAEEQRGIIKSRYVNADNPRYETDGGKDTEDYVSLLSREDIVNKEYGFPTDYYCGHPSRIACDEKGYDEDGDGSWWWLRSPFFTSSALNVSYNGYVDDNDVDNEYGGVHPALHFNLSSYPLTKKGIVTAEVGGIHYISTTPGEPTNKTEAPTERPTDKTETSTGESTDKTEVPTEKPANKTEAPTEKPADKTEATTEKPTVTTETPIKKEDKLTTFNIKNKKTYKQSKKVTVKDKDGIKQIKLNNKKIKVGGKKSYSFKLSKYKKYLKKKGKWNKLVVTDKNGKKKTIQFKTK